MKRLYLIVPLLAGCALTALAENPHIEGDSTDIFYQHLNLQEITVTGLTGASRLHESPMPITVIGNHELTVNPASNAIDAIATAPGVDQITTGSGISKPVIRGLGYNRVLVVNDGVRQEGQQWGDEHGIEIDGYDIGAVEIIRGPASLMYGSDAMAGVVIFRHNPFPQRGSYSAAVASEYNTGNGLWGITLSTAGNSRVLAWEARYSDRHAHSYRNRYDGYVPGTQFMERSVAARLGLNRNWGHSHLSFSHYHSTPGIAEGERDPVTGDLEAEQSPKSYTPGLPFQKIYHTKVVSDNLVRLASGRLSAIVGFQQNRRKEFEESASEPGLSLRLNTVNYDARYVHTGIDGWEIAAGANGMGQASTNHGDEFLIPDYNLFDLGLFTTARFDIDDWHLTGGFRYDHRRLHSHRLIDDGDVRFDDFKRSFNGFSCGIGASFCPFDWLTFRANIAHGWRAPSINELASNGVHEGTLHYEVGNQELSPEKSWQFDLGFDLSSRYVAFSLSAFANLVNDYIFNHRVEVTIDPEHPTYIYDAGDARLLGFEASLDVHPIHSLHLSNSFSYVNAQLLRQPAASRYLPLTPAPRLCSELKYEITHGEAHLFRNAYARVGMRWHLAQNHFYAADDTETATPAYVLFDLGIGSDIRFGKRVTATLALTLENVFDKAYQSHLSRLKYADINPVTGRRGVFNPGRNLAIKLAIPLSF